MIQLIVYAAVGLIAAGAAAFAALPFLRPPKMRREQERSQLAVIERRDRALAALRELEFDHRTGKISDEDYRAAVGPLRRRAAEALKALDPQPGATEKVHAPS